MKPNHKVILSIIEKALEEDPSLRFGQVLFNLNINQFQNPSNPEAEKHLLRDIYNDADEKILERMRE